VHVALWQESTPVSYSIQVTVMDMHCGFFHHQSDQMLHTFVEKLSIDKGPKSCQRTSGEYLGIIWLQNFLVNYYDKNLRSENWGAALTFISYDMSTCVALCAGCLDSRTNPVFKFQMWVRMFGQSCTHICLMGNTITFDHNQEFISTYNSTVKLFSKVESSKSWNLQKDHIYTYVWREIVNCRHVYHENLETE
jgi:hypothetical protein